MQNIKGEEFEDFINNGKFSISKMNFFKKSIDIFNIKRDEELNIVLHVEIVKYNVSYSVKENSGKREVAQNFMRLENQNNDVIIAKNIVPTSFKLKLSEQSTSFNCIVQEQLVASFRF